MPTPEVSTDAILVQIKKYKKTCLQQNPMDYEHLSVSDGFPFSTNTYFYIENVAQYILHVFLDDFTR
jgi:hypothetical protein